MLGTNEMESGMLTNTLTMFRTAEDNLLTVEQGALLIDGWMQALDGDPNLEQLKGQLGELQTALRAQPVDESYIRTLMVSLADKTQEVAEGPDAEGTWTGGLESLSKILRSFGN